MYKKTNLIISTVFVLVVLFLGVFTIKSSSEELLALIKESSLSEVTTNIESKLSDNFFKKYTWLNINGEFQKIIGVTYIREASGGSDVYKLKNGQTMYSLKKRNMVNYAKNVKDLSDFCNERNIKFLYVQLPFKIESDSVMPLGASEGANENADELIKYLRSYDVNCIDIREKIVEENLKYQNLFFNTDHHWRPSAALWSAGIINSELLTEDVSFFYDNSNYQVETLEKWFLGSLGKRTGSSYAGVDDFDLIYPKFETNFKFWAKTKSGQVIRRTGTFKDVMFDREKLDTKDYFNINTYAGYIGGDYPVNTIINKDREDGKIAFLVRDSYSCTMEPYLSLAYYKTYALDLRHYKKSLKDYIENKKPNYVIVAYNPSAFESNQFDFDN